MKLEFSVQVYEKYSNIKFHENPSSGSFSKCCDRALKASLCTRM